MIVSKVPRGGWIGTTQILVLFRFRLHKLKFSRHATTWWSYMSKLIAIASIQFIQRKGTRKGKEVTEDTKTRRYSRVPPQREYVSLEGCELHHKGLLSATKASPYSPMASTSQGMSSTFHCGILQGRNPAPLQQPWGTHPQLNWGLSNHHKLDYKWPRFSSRKP